MRRALTGREMGLGPLLAALYCGGRPTFWIGYRRGSRCPSATTLEVID